MPVRRVDVVIPINTSISGAALIGGKIIAVLMPAAWTAAGLSFEMGVSEAGPFFPVVDNASAEITLAAPAVGKAIIPTASIRASVIRVRSGTSAAGVNQQAARTVTLLVSDEGL